MKSTATITDRDAMKGVTITVTVHLRRTARWAIGFQILRWATTIAALLMGCEIRVNEGGQS